MKKPAAIIGEDATGRIRAEKGTKLSARTMSIAKIWQIDADRKSPTTQELRDRTYKLTESGHSLHAA